MPEYVIVKINQYQQPKVYKVSGANPDEAARKFVSTKGNMHINNVTDEVAYQWLAEHKYSDPGIVEDY